MDSIQPIHVLITLGGLGVPTLLMLWKIVRVVARMEFKMDLLWKDYQEREEDRRLQVRSGFDRRRNPGCVTP